MWLLFLLLTGAEFFVIAEDAEEIKDGELSRKILGQSVVTSVSVVMDIGNGTKTIYSDPLGKPMDKPSSPSDLASPINLLNPDRYEFYTFDDSGNLVRRLMSLEEIKGIIATGDSDGLEYDSTFSEAYIPEKRVNDVLSNVQNVLKEEMEIHNTKLDTFPTLDTPDVSDSWNMILPAVFGNSGADITPEKAPLHITPDTIMIEPTERSQSTARSTPLTSSTTSMPQKVSSLTLLSSYSTPLSTTASTTTTTKTRTTSISTTTTTTPTTTTTTTPTTTTTTTTTTTPSTTTTITTPSTTTTTILPPSTTTTSTPPPSRTTTTTSTTTTTAAPTTEIVTNSKEPEKTTVLTTESKETEIALEDQTDITTKEYIPVSTITTENKLDKTSTTPLETDTTLKFTTASVETEYVKIDPITTSTEISKPNVTTENEYIKINPILSSTTEKVTDISTTETFVTVTVPTLILNKTEITTSMPEDKVTHLSELTIQSVESTINCTSDKNEIDTTTISPALDDINSIDKIAAPEILTQLLLSPLDHGVNTDILRETMHQLFNNAHIQYTNDSIEATTEIINNTVKPETTLNYVEITLNNENNTKTSINVSSSTEEYMSTVRVPLIPTNYSNQMEETSVIPTTFQILNISELNETENSTDLPITTDGPLTTEMLLKPVIQISNGVPVKSTKIETANETVIDVNTDIYEEIKKTTTESGSTESEILNTTTILVPLTLVDASSFNSIEQSNNTVRVPLIDPSDSLKSSSTTISTVEPSVSIIISETENVNKLNEAVSNSTASMSSATTESSVTDNISGVTSATTESSDKLNSITPSTSSIDVKMETSTNQNSIISTAPSSLATTEKLITTTEKEKPLMTQKTTIVTQSPLTTETMILSSKDAESKKNETNWALVSTIAPHSGSTSGSSPTPPFIENYPDVLEHSEPIDLKAEPFSGFGLEDSTSTLEKDIYQFSQLYNELAFEFWKKNTHTLSHARSLVLSPFGAISLLAMIFLGARGSTSAEMNEILKLDDMITFNPHLVLKNVGESIIPEEKDSGVVTSAIIKEMFSDKGKGKILPFYKERVRAFYDGYVEEVNFTEIGDILRRRTNLQVKKQSMGKIVEFLSDLSITGKPPLLGLSVNIFQTDCSATSSDGRDGEMHFTVLPSIRQRRLVPIPAALYRSGFLAGYEPSLDATAVSFGDKTKTVSTIFVMPGQQGMPAPGDGLARLEKSLVESSFKKGAWSRLLRSLIPRSGLEVQIPKIIHRSVINTTHALSQMGFAELFNKEKADLMGMNGVTNELYLSDILQINQFTTCGERRTDHHSEIYPSSSTRSRHLMFLDDEENEEHLARDLSSNSFQDPLHDLSYLDLPLPLRPRQARKPEVPRLRFDRPFLYFVRHNPTGLILHIGRFNPRLLP